MGELILLSDGSVDNLSKIGFGAYLVIDNLKILPEKCESLVKVKRFEQTSSSKLELQTLLWALSDFPTSEKKLLIYTDSQNIVGLQDRRSRLEKNNYQSKKKEFIENYQLYQEFFRITDKLNFELIKLKGHKTEHNKTLIERLFTMVDRTSRKALREDI